MKAIILLASILLAASTSGYSSADPLLSPRTDILVFNSEGVKVVKTGMNVSGGCTPTKTYIEYYKCNDNISKSSTCSVWTDMEGKQCRVTCEPHTCPAGI
ncbi:hypothetical protein EKL29_10355 [Pantoea sp. YU22]|uniref:hypothetical protein n=1 Tax=Pantoea sp. YU22 TaxID=2497684 RepID=UPI000F88AD0F|nr:hypothetical protein [Pantoea sp. YU22]RTY57973.1 hypothetical protein EKL29_10355 [Pantoea sp. YU22]